MHSAAPWAWCQHSNTDTSFPDELKHVNEWYSLHALSHLLLDAVWGIAFAGFLMGLTLMQGAAAFGTCSSIASAGLCIDYALPIAFRLFLAGDSFEPGPFTLGR